MTKKTLKRDLWIRIGSKILDAMTESALKNNLDRSAWSEGVLRKIVKTGFAKDIKTELIIEAQKHDGKTLLRIDADLARVVSEQAEALEISLTDYVIYSMVTELG